MGDFELSSGRSSRVKKYQFKLADRAILWRDYFRSTALNFFSGGAIVLMWNRKQGMGSRFLKSNPHKSKRLLKPQAIVKCDHRYCRLGWRRNPPFHSAQHLFVRSGTRSQSLEWEGARGNEVKSITVRQPRYPKEGFARRGNEIFELRDRVRYQLFR